MIITANNKVLDLANCQIMGILNVTPDSFSDGGRFNSVDSAVGQAKAMMAAGASIIDIGGESTRPGANEVSLDEELARVIPVIKAIRQSSDVWLSIDTSKAQVMQAAIDAGVDMINDIRALREPGALEVAASCDLPICLMHMQGQPRSMQTAPHYTHLMDEVLEFLQQRIEVCLAAGIARSRLIIDPGFGFGKSLEHNYQMLAQFDDFLTLDLPVLVGTSRKSMLFRPLEKAPAECVSATLMSSAYAIMKGAKIVRVHDVEPLSDALKVLELIALQQGSQIKR